MITNVKYISDDKYTNYAVSIVYNNDTSTTIQTLVDKPDNTDYQNILQWVAEGNTITAADQEINYAKNTSNNRQYNRLSSH